MTKKKCECESCNIVINLLTKIRPELFEEVNIMCKSCGSIFRKKMIKEYEIEIETKDVAVFKTENCYLLKKNNLKWLNLRNNQITKIENLNENLEWLELENNQITKIDNLNENLKWLNLRNNQITKIENLNENLEWLELENNQITKIDNLNENLKWLDLDNNQITKIENLNENLEWLNLRNNPVKEITQNAYDLIKKRKIKVFGVDVDKLKIVENEKC